MSRRCIYLRLRDSRHAPHPPRCAREHRSLCATLPPNANLLACRQALYARCGVPPAGISVLELDSESDDLGRVIFRPEVLVSVLRAVVESHRGELAEKQGYHI